jgi:hypothetical protein
LFTNSRLIQIPDVSYLGLPPFMYAIFRESSS